MNQLNEKAVYEAVRNYTKDYDKFWIHNKIHHEINVYCSKHTLEEIYIKNFDTLDEELRK